MWASSSGSIRSRCGHGSDRLRSTRATGPGPRPAQTGVERRADLPHAHRSGHPDRAEHLRRLHDPPALEADDSGQGAAGPDSPCPGEELRGLRREEAPRSAAPRRRHGRALHRATTDAGGRTSRDHSREGPADHACRRWPDTGLDLVERDFTASAPDQLPVADTTCWRTFAGWVYAAFVIDVLSRRVLGWQLSTTLPGRPRPGRAGDGPVDPSTLRS